MQRILGLIAVLAMLACGAAPRTPAPPAPREVHRAVVSAHVAPYLEAQLLDSVVIGLLVNDTAEVYGFGRGPRAGQPPDGATAFELGSVTKVYTGLLLAAAQAQGRVTLAQDATRALLSSGGPVLSYASLATHTSGLPRLPPSLVPQLASLSDPYAGYDTAALRAELVAMPALAPGPMAYSNLGYGLLGYALGHAFGSTYGEALQREVLAPLGLTQTRLSQLSTAPSANLVSGTDDDLQPRAAWRWAVLAGAGALISTTHDQLTLLRAYLAVARGDAATLPTGVRAALTQAMQALAPPPHAMAYGWHIDRAGRYWHNGATGGYHAYLGFDPKKQIGVVVLAANSTNVIDELGLTMLAIAAGAPPAVRSFTDAAGLGRLVGNYDFGAVGAMEVRLEAGRLYAVTPDAPRQRLVELRPQLFSVAANGATYEFIADGTAMQLKVRLGEATYEGRRPLGPGAK